jgi:hypothetical protein
MSLKNRNLNRLLKEMKKHVQEVNDQEICRRFETLIKGGNEEDIQAQVMSRILEDPFDVEENEIPEIYLMYFRHYRFMRKRYNRQVERGEIDPHATGRGKSSASKSRKTSSGNSTSKSSSSKASSQENSSANTAKGSKKSR